MRYIPLAFTLLAGCASVGDLQSSEPDRSGQSTKPIDEVSRCIAYKSAAAPITNEAGHPVFIMTNGYGAPLATITLIGNDAGTKIEVRQANGIVQTGFWRDCI